MSKRTNESEAGPAEMDTLLWIAKQNTRLHRWRTESSKRRYKIKMKKLVKELFGTILLKDHEQFSKLICKKMTTTVTCMSLYTMKNINKERKNKIS